MIIDRTGVAVIAGVLIKGIHTAKVIVTAVIRAGVAVVTGAERAT